MNLKTSGSSYEGLSGDTMPCKARKTKGNTLLAETAFSCVTQPARVPMGLMSTYQERYTHPTKRLDWGVCMQGSIITRQKCFMCGKYLKHDEKRRGCSCPDHPDVAATRFIVRFPGGIYQNFKSYEAATQHLNYLRHEKNVRQGRFNPDDYRSVRPNSFAGLKDKYLARKKTLASYRKVEYSINLASTHFSLTNVREITGADIEDYLFSIPDISEKTRFNHCSYLRDFWKWCLSRGVITMAEMPIFPKIDFTLGYRKIITWEIQGAVLDKVKEIGSPKVFLALDMLSTYTKLRPDDLRRVTEGSLDNNGWLTIHNPTKIKNKFKYVHLHPDHVEAWRALQKQFPGLPDAPFFRSAKTGKVFGKNHLYKWWIRACDLIGLQGVPLYPGTKHTTATETAKLMGADKARNASGLTNKAFDRYCQTEDDGAYEVVSAIRKQKANVIPMRKRGAE